MRTLESGMNTIVLDGNKIISINERELWNLNITLHNDWENAMSCFIDNMLNGIMIEQCQSFEEVIETVIKPQWKFWDLDHENESTVYDYDTEKLQIGMGYKIDNDRDYMTVVSPMITIKLKK